MEDIYVHVMDNLLGVATKGAETFLALCRREVVDKGRFVVGLSGGNTPRPMYRLLGSEPYISEIPWRQVHIFWVDERVTPYDSDYSNYGIARREFLAQIPIPSQNVHPVLVDRDAEASASTYEQEIMGFFSLPPGHCPSFDALFLGLGEDGHIASLFPKQSGRDHPQRLIISTQGGKPSLPRVTMTPRLINNSKSIIFLVSGRQKAGVVRDTLERRNPTLPSVKISPSKGSLTWIVDREAASGLRPPYPGGELRLVNKHDPRRVTPVA